MYNNICQQDSGPSPSGKATDSDSVIQGSNPCGPAKKPQ